MEENRHGPERLGQITPKREKNRGKNNSGGVGVVLGNRCLKVLRGGCTVLPKTSFPLLELIPSSKGLGLGPLGVPSSLSHWIWDHSCACLAVFGL